MTPTTYGRDFAYCLKSHGGVRGFNASLWRFLLRCTLFCHSVATFLTSVSSYEGGCGFEDKKQFYFNVKKKKFIDYGLGIGQNFCMGTCYTIVLRPILISEFVKEKYPMTYYQTNCLPDSTGERYIEYVNNVPLKNYSFENNVQSNYVDIDHIVYKILSIDPKTCLLWYLQLDK